MRSPRFIKSATRKDQYPASPLPRIAFVGRSNVGKSSLLNCLVETKNLARTSSTPGRTQIINFFTVDDAWMFVDLPGYGYAHVPKRIRARWPSMIEEFLADSRRLRLAVVLVDGRHKPTTLDQRMIRWLVHFGIRFQVVATKIDKVSSHRRTTLLAQIGEILGVAGVVPFSAVTGEGKKVLWRIIGEVCPSADEVK